MTGRRGPRVAGFLTRPGLDSTLKVTPVENLSPLRGRFSWGEPDTCLRCREGYLAGIGGAGLLYCGPCQRFMRDIIWRLPITDLEREAAKGRSWASMMKTAIDDFEDLPEAYRLERGVS